MNVILTTLNSRYTHMSLSLRYLRSALEQRFTGSSPEPRHMLNTADPAEPGKGPVSITLLEFTINQPHEQILRTLFEASPDYLCFSVYIWNVEATLKLAASLKKVLPGTVILFGGPESAYDAVKYLETYNFLDAVVTGEGEKILGDYVERQINRGKAAVPGLVERTPEGIVNYGKAPLIQALDSIPFPYKEEELSGHRMLYYEASRGCPYRCAYCLSSREPGVRVFGLDRVLDDLGKFLKAEVMQVKFVDRTFNIDPVRTRAIFQYLIEHDNGITGFHFEITAALIREEDLELLSKARPGQFQFEIGVQSTCEEAMMAVHRPLPFERTAEVCRKLRALGNIHLHLDLIAGLPFETYERFLNSFDEVYSLSPHALQLGFLKLIPGSPLSEEAAKYGYIKEDHPPYEVLGNHKLSFAQLTQLKRVEALVDIFYNSHGFTQTLSYALGRSGLTPSAFFTELSEFFRGRSYDQQAYRSEAHYSHLEAYLEEQSWYDPVFRGLLDYDCLVALAKRRRESEMPEAVRGLIHDALRTSDASLPVKTILKRVRYQIFDFDVKAWLEGVTEGQPQQDKVWLGWVDTTRRSAVNGHYEYAQAILEVKLWKF